MTSDPLDFGMMVRREDHSLRFVTAERIRQAILNLQYKPGQRLTERELCAFTGVSRSLMREVLRHLESEGLISHVPHKGPSVARLGVQEAREIYQVRSALEPLAARLYVAEASSNDLREIEKLARAFQTSVESADAPGVAAALGAFYSALYSATGNRLVVDIGRNLSFRTRLLRAVTFIQMSATDRRASVARNRRITACLLKRDAEAAAKACLEHVERSAKVAERLFAAQLKGDEAPNSKRAAKTEKSAR